MAKTDSLSKFKKKSKQFINKQTSRLANKPIVKYLVLNIYIKKVVLLFHVIFYVSLKTVSVVSFEFAFTTQLFSIFW